MRSSAMIHGARHMIVREGELPRQVFILFSGWAFQFHLLPDGRRQIFSFLLPGDFIGAEGLIDLPSIYSVQALTRVQLCAFDAEELGRALHQNAELRDRFNAYFYDEVAVLAGRLIDLGRRTATERIVRLVLEIEQRAKTRGLLSNGTIPFPLRQTHIADALGLTAVHVNRTINALRRDGLITFHRGAMVIEDRNALEEIGGSRV
jgi:CRP-like cAMP-binding protein